MFLQVIQLSEAFIDLLNKCTLITEEEPKSEHSIGNCFIQTEPEFRRVYGLYCINHDNAQFLLEKVKFIGFYFLIDLGLTVVSSYFQYETVPTVNKLLDDGVASLRNQIVCFNMGSVIIKPVQRIMKYPLILSELIKVIALFYNYQHMSLIVNS